MFFKKSDFKGHKATLNTVLQLHKDHVDYYHTENSLKLVAFICCTQL